MNSLSRRIALIVLLAAVAGCSSVKEAKNSVSGWINGSDDANALSTKNGKKAAVEGSGPNLKYAATLRIDRYADKRNTSNPRLLGVTTQHVSGISGNQLLLDQDLAALVTTAIRTRFDSEGYQVLEGGSAGNARFEVSGVIKELTLNVKDRDEISIAIETTLKDTASGEVVWSGMVTEKHDRFAGVSGNNKDDVIAYLNSELEIASNKTVEAVSASLMASKPELFNLTPGAKTISGVTVYVAPTVAKPAPAAMPETAVTRYDAQPVIAAPAPAPASAYIPHASATAGLLLVTTSPPRAKVYLDDVYYGLSPLRLEMEPGIHAISVKLDSYKMVTEKVSVRKGDSTEMELKLEH